MDIFVYSDESGVFDKEHNDIFVFGGLILLGKGEKDNRSRMYSAAEKAIRSNGRYAANMELKASVLTNGDKNKLYRSLNNCHKFGVVVRQQRVLDRIFKSKKDKQRFLDYVYKISVKRAFERMLKEGIIISEIERIHFYVDEHTTATNGCYELREALEQELKRGTYNQSWNAYYPPVFPSINDVTLSFCNSATTTLVRASDIVANKIFYLARTNESVDNNEHLTVTNLPW